jgi:CRP-like cAMP-binding protein
LRQFSTNEVIIHESEPGESAYVIEKGAVIISKFVDGKQVHIATLEKGATFGEMSMIDEMPRSATVTAKEETLVREIHRDELYNTMKESPEVVMVLLKRIFERLRESNMLLAQSKVPNAQHPVARVQEAVLAKSAIVCTLEGLTTEAGDAMPQNPIKFGIFPFKIGRKSRDPIVSNHLEIQDQAPLQISRHHVSIVKVGDRIGVVDRGSQLGASVDGVRIGGSASPGPVFFKDSEGLLVLGPETSPYRFKISLGS